MSSKEKPYILFVAEKIYLEIQQIKKKNPDFSNIDAVDNFIGSKTYYWRAAYIISFDCSTYCLSTT